MPKIVYIADQIADHPRWGRLYKGRVLDVSHEDAGFMVKRDKERFKKQADWEKSPAPKTKKKKKGGNKK